MPALPTGIDRLPSGQYRIRVTVDGRRITRTTRTLSQARQLRTDLEQTAPTRAGTVNELLERWIEVKADTIADSTLMDYKYLIGGHIRPAIGSLEVSDVHPAVIAGLYRQLLATGLSTARVRHVHIVLSQACRLAVRWGDIPVSPVDAVDPPTVRRHEITPPTPGQIASIVDKIDHPGMAMFVRLAVISGARRGEMVALRGDDINLDTAELLISRALTRADTNGPTHGTPIPGLAGVVEKDTKTHAARRLALDHDTITMLRAHRRMLAARALSCGVGLNLEQHRWFTDDPAAVTPWRPEQVNRWWDHARNAAGLPHVRLHDLRHFAATQALAAGVDVRTVAGRLGHANPSMTLDRYSHVVPAADRAAADILGKIVGG